MTVAEVGTVIRSCPDEFLATIRPIIALRKLRPPDVTRVNYVTVLPNLMSRSSPEPEFVGKDTIVTSDSLDDVSTYDDEDEALEVEGPPSPLPGKLKVYSLLIMILRIIHPKVGTELTQQGTPVLVLGSSQKFTYMKM
jgi:hypothetical protein